jgi:hypothetical protein
MASAMVIRLPARSNPFELNSNHANVAKTSPLKNSTTAVHESAAP